MNLTSLVVPYVYDLQIKVHTSHFFMNLTSLVVPYVYDLQIKVHTSHFS